MSTQLYITRESHFLIECRACSRTLIVPKALLDELVVCRHCKFQFVAFDPSSPAKATRKAEFLLHRVDNLIAKFRQVAGQ
jgi:hypothetical protein